MTIYAIDDGKNTVLTALEVDPERFTTERTGPAYLSSAEFTILVDKGTTSHVKYEVLE